MLRAREPGPRGPGLLKMLLWAQARLDERELDLGKTQNARSNSDEYEKDSLSDFVLWKGRKPEDGTHSTLRCQVARSSSARTPSRAAAAA